MKKIFKSFFDFFQKKQRGEIKKSDKTEQKIFFSDPLHPRKTIQQLRNDEYWEQVNGGTIVPPKNKDF